MLTNRIRNEIRESTELDQNRSKSQLCLKSFADLYVDQNLLAECVVVPLMAQHPLVGHGLLIVEVSPSHLDAPQSVGRLWTSDQPDTETPPPPT
jgi:hypothetical protein